MGVCYCPFRRCETCEENDFNASECLRKDGMPNVGLYMSSEDLKPAHKDQVLDMISRSFAEKGDLTTLADVTYNDLMEQLEMLWSSHIDDNLTGSSCTVGFIGIVVVDLHSI